MAKHHQHHHVEIHPDGHGGHRVVHHIHSMAQRSRNAPSGFAMGEGSTEEKYFGEGEEHKTLAHVAKILDIELPSNFGKHMSKSGKTGAESMDTEDSRHEVGEEMD